MTGGPPPRTLYTVSALTALLRVHIESAFPDIWVEGEVSNLRIPTSGHAYFTLKDASSQIRAVLFRSVGRSLRFAFQDGLQLVCRGRVTIYEPKGDYQVIVEYAEPKGVGALQLAFEQLKARLAAEGLFDPARKRPLPVLPRAIGVVTSPAGAVIRDILLVLRRRFRNMNVLVYPVRVQGEGAAREIAQGIERFNRRPLAAGLPPVDVIILARGGGSLEDLWAFNEEAVARAIAASKIPVISGVGHETDFTIADFVADLRAPTPSAAAELVVHRKQDFVAELEDRARRMSQVMRLKLSEARQRLTELRMHRVFETVRGRLAERAQRVDDCGAALDRSLGGRLSESRHEYLRASAGVDRLDFRPLLGLKRAQLEERSRKFQTEFRQTLAERRNRLTQAEMTLRERSPVVILSRGDSITRDAPG